MRYVQLIQNLPYDLAPIQDITDTLPARKNDPEPYRKTSDITHISVHHSGVEGGTIKGYADYHVNTLKWYHIGYHMVIVGNRIYQTNDLQTFSYHTSGNNHYTVGISVSGDFTKRPLSDGERQALYGAILTVMDIFKIPVERVLGHNEYPGQNTDCPAFDMNRVREDIKTLQQRMSRVDSWHWKNEQVKDLCNEINFLTSRLALGESDGNAQWAMNNLLGIREIAKAKGLLN